MILVGGLLIMFSCILIYWKSRYSPFKSQFNKRMQAYTTHYGDTNEMCTREEIEKLPLALQRYCNYIGLENSPKYQVTNVFFKQTDFIFDDESEKKLKMDYDLWLFKNTPIRSAYCTSGIYGIPFEGEDYCTDQKEGGMKGYLGKTIRLFDTHDKQGYKAGLISWVIESAIFNPSALLSEHLSYKEIDDHHVQVCIQYEDIAGTGVFTIDDEGAIIEFYSDERQVEKINGVDTMIGWRCESEDYVQQRMFRLPKVIRSIKVYPDKEVVYFESDDYEIKYLK